MQRLSLLFLMVSVIAACSKAAVTNPGPVSPQNTAEPEAFGTINGGGGVGLRCGDHLEMLDLYEARKAKFKMAKVTNEQEAAELVGTRIAKHFWNVDMDVIENTSKGMVEMVTPILEQRPFYDPENRKNETVEFVDSLPLSNDFGKYVVPVGCKLEQVAFFSDTKTTLSIVKSAWAKLDWLSRAVLAAHELMYMTDRRDGLMNLVPQGITRTSESARKFVAQLLSDPPLTAKSDHMPSKDQLYVCMAEKTQFYAFVNDDKLSLVFSDVLSYESFYQMRVDFKNSTLEELTSGQLQEEAPLQLVDSGQKSEFSVRLMKTADGDPEVTVLYAGQPVHAAQVLNCRSMANK